MIFEFLLSCLVALCVCECVRAFSSSASPPLSPSGARGPPPRSVCPQCWYPAVSVELRSPRICCAWNIKSPKRVGLKDLVNAKRERERAEGEKERMEDSKLKEHHP